MLLTVGELKIDYIFAVFCIIHLTYSCFNVSLLCNNIILSWKYNIYVRFQSNF